MNQPQVEYLENGVLCYENFNESDFSSNLAKAMQYALALKEMGSELITNVRVVMI